MKNILYLLIAVSFYSYANEADVLGVVIKHSFDNVYSFDVTVNHQDEGWDHFANGWEVLSPEGKVLAVRVLQHPHVKEQPFTRSLLVKIPQGLSEVIIRAHDSVHEYGGCEVTVEILVKLPVSETESGR